MALTLSLPRHHRVFPSPEQIDSQTMGERASFIACSALGRSKMARETCEMRFKPFWSCPHWASV